MLAKVFSRLTMPAIGWGKIIAIFSPNSLLEGCENQSWTREP
jgi:hypothetical protein